MRKFNYLLKGGFALLLSISLNFSFGQSCNVDANAQDGGGLGGPCLSNSCFGADTPSDVEVKWNFGCGGCTKYLYIQVNGITAEGAVKFLLREGGPANNCNTCNLFDIEGPVGTCTSSMLTGGEWDPGTCTIDDNCGSILNIDGNEVQYCGNETSGGNTYFYYKIKSRPNQGISHVSFVGCGTTDLPAPVKMLYFTGSEKNRKSTLQWATASEINNKGFEIQRSPDGVLFEKIEFVPGAGTSAETLEYSYMDNEPYSGNNYYRLKQIDYSGDYEMSDVVPLMIESEVLAEVIPNPSSSEELSVNIFAEKESEGQIAIYDLSKLVWHNERHHLKSGGNMLDFSHLNLPEGIYLLRTVINNTSRVTKFIIQK